MLLNSIIRYLFSAQDEHSIHSPFVFDLYVNIIKKDTQNADFKLINKLRNTLKSRQDTIQITDFGAGSKINPSNIRSIRDIAKNSEKPPRLGRLFYKIIQKFNSKTIFDLGTSLGITTAYLALGNEKSEVFTFEGCVETAKIAQQNFKELGIENVEIIIGNIDETLVRKIETVSKIDFAFFDANHRYEPTVKYFETCLEKTHEDSIFIFDDIHWSAEMEAAWKTIKAHSSVTITIDLLWVGIVFFRKKQPKQDFILRFPFW